MDRKVIYTPNSKDTLNDRIILGGDRDGVINFTKIKDICSLKLWQNIWDNLFITDLFLTKEDRIQIILNRYNYWNLSYWEREALIKELKATCKDKDSKNIEKFRDIISSLKNITKTLSKNTLTQTTKELRTIPFLKNIFGNNSSEKPNNK